MDRINKWLMACEEEQWLEEYNMNFRLVGPSEVIEVKVDGVKQKSEVLIKKCRYLENSGCVGMCVNMCKIPTQNFFTSEFGLPLTMNPNFEDMSRSVAAGNGSSSGSGNSAGSGESGTSWRCDGGGGARGGGEHGAAVGVQR